MVHTEKFKVGDMVKCLRIVYFMDGTKHHTGEVLHVTEENVSYFNVMCQDYSLYLEDMD